MKGLFVAAILAVLLLAALASGASIEGPDKVEAGKPEWFSLVVPAESSGSFFPSRHLDTGDHVVDGSALFWAQEPGEYLVTAVAIDWAAKRIFPMSKIVTVTGVPGPDPPDPGPDPPDPGGKKQVVICYERSHLHKMSAAQQRLLTSVTFRERLISSGHILRGIVDQDIINAGGSVPEALAPFLQAVTDSKASLPVLAEAPWGGGQVTVYALPADDDAVFKLLGEAK